MVRYDPTIYDGAAVHYRYGRPAYSRGLEALLAEELGLDGSGRLLDVGCGPGILTVRLARLFEEAVGLDPDPEMIAEGRRAGPVITAKTLLPAPALVRPRRAPACGAGRGGSRAAP
jgi:trans-aconitate methyltransferase